MCCYIKLYYIDITNIYIYNISKVFRKNNKKILGKKKKQVQKRNVEINVIKGEVLEGLLNENVAT